MAELSAYLAISTKEIAMAKNIVLVHGGFVDGAGWEGVYKILKRDGYNVSVVQNPTISLDDDVAVTKRILAAQDGPAILVGHSYGGAVITEAGSHPKVAGLVYITAFAPDKGESVASLIENPPPGARTVDTAAARRLSIPRQGEVPRLFRGRRGRGKSCVHG
jgi:pimeloyl-ACP methyl ester carboxylesterase